MERILPIDLERAEIKKTLRGYSPQTVDDLLSRAAATIESLLNESQNLREQNQRLRFERDVNLTNEDTLKQTLVLAQKTADETRAAAQKQAEVILEEARQSALAEKVAGQQTISEMRWEIERLRSERNRFQSEMRDLLARQMRELDAITPSFAVVEAQSTVAR